MTLSKSHPASASREKANCLLCGEAEQKPLYSGLAGVVFCASCGFVYTSPRLTRDALEKLYSEEYFSSGSSQEIGYDHYISDEALVKKTFLKRLRELERSWVKPKGRLLDVGCATGFFLHVAQQLGWHVDGVEISKFCCDYARDRFGILLHNGHFEEAKLFKPEFDLITMWDYIEHSLRPDLDIQKAFELLRPGGVLAITTPDYSSLPRKIFRDRWMGFKEHEHLYYFTGENLGRLLQKKGFCVLSSRYAGKYISPEFFAKRLASYSGLAGSLAKGVSQWPPLKKLQFYCNPLDIIYLVAKKSS